LTGISLLHKRLADCWWGTISTPSGHGGWPLSTSLCHPLPVLRAAGGDTTERLPLNLNPPGLRVFCGVLAGQEPSSIRRALHPEGERLSCKNGLSPDQMSGCSGDIGWIHAHHNSPFEEFALIALVM
jgi:hypothetical protein